MLLHSTHVTKERSVTLTFLLHGSLRSKCNPHFASFAPQATDNDASVGLKQLLLTADVVVYDLLGHERATRDALVQLAQQPVGDSAGVAGSRTYIKKHMHTHAKHSSDYPSAYAGWGEFSPGQEGEGWSLDRGNARM